jgi:hypothetical protein
MAPYKKHALMSAAESKIILQHFAFRKIHANLSIRSFRALSCGFVEVAIFDGTVVSQMK